jgi:hypothetical protein
MEKEYSFETSVNISQNCVRGAQCLRLDLNTDNPVYFLDYTHLSGTVFPNLSLGLPHGIHVFPVQNRCIKRIPELCHQIGRNVFFRALSYHHAWSFSHIIPHYIILILYFSILLQS